MGLRGLLGIALMGPKVFGVRISHRFELASEPTSLGVRCSLGVRRSLGAKSPSREVAVRLGLLSISEPSEAPSKDTPTKDNCVVIVDFHPLYSECDPRIGKKNHAANRTA